MPKSSTQTEKEVAALHKWLDLVYNQGVGKIEAAGRVGYSREGIRKIQLRHLPNSFEDTLKEGKFDPHSWDHGWLKTNDVSIHIRNRETNKTWEEHRNDFIKDACKHAPRYPKIKREKPNDGHLLVLDIADLHVGKFSHPSETGELYDIETAILRAKDGIAGVLAKSSGFPIDQILFVAGNDILHVDSPHRKTTSGTPQDTDGNWYQAYIAARKLYVSIIESLVSIADTHVVFNPSNHDYMSGGALIDSIASWFHNCMQVSFDADMRHRKYFLYGKSLIGTSHGDGGAAGKRASNLVKTMADEQPQLWAKTQYRYWYLHHLHHFRAMDDIGATVELLRSASAPDRWHDVNLYRAKPAVEGFIHSKEAGQVAKITHYL